MDLQPHLLHIALASLGVVILRVMLFNRRTLPPIHRLLTSEKQRTLYAYHEAGHALALIKLDCGRELDHVTIEPSNRGLFHAGGHTQVKNIQEEITQEQAHNWLICELAGEAAENIFENTPLKNRHTATRDKKTARKLCEKTGTDLEAARQEAHNFIKENEGILNALAKSLLKKGTLRAEEL